jgi:hypothetical protein
MIMDKIQTISMGEPVFLSSLKTVMAMPLAWTERVRWTICRSYIFREKGGSMRPSQGQSKHLSIVAQQQERMIAVMTALDTVSRAAICAALRDLGFLHQERP